MMSSALIVYDYLLGLSPERGDPAVKLVIIRRIYGSRCRNHNYKKQFHV